MANINERMDEAEVLLAKLQDLHDRFTMDGSPSNQIPALVGAMMVVLTNVAFPRDPSAADVAEFPARLLDMNVVWEEFVRNHRDASIYSGDLFRKWVWGLYRQHRKTRMGLWKILGWEEFNTDEDEVKDEEDS